MVTPIFKLGRKLPVKQFLGGAVILLMSTSIAFLGNAVRSLQEADVLSLHRWGSWPAASRAWSTGCARWTSSNATS